MQPTPKSTKDVSFSGSEATNISLVVLDDNAADLEYIQSILDEVAHTSYATYCFKNIKDTLDFIVNSDEKIDCCLVDYSLNGETAFDFVLKLKSSVNVIPPVVVMTGAYNQEVDERLMYSGIHDYWNKNELNTATLERCIRYSIHRYQNFQKKQKESEYKSQHLAQICHELKNPLNAILGFSKYAQQRWNVAETEQQRTRIEESFNGVLSNCSHLSSILDELLNVSEIESGNASLRLSEFELFPFLEEIVKSHLSFAESRGIGLKFSAKSQQTICADKKRLKQIVSNLVSNAIKYSDHGLVSVTTLILDGNSIMFNVEDNGIGINEKDLERIFVDYVTVHNNEERDVDSTGLGLPIVKKLVELHGGSITVESQIGIGSSFKVVIPQ